MPCLDTAGTLGIFFLLAALSSLFVMCIANSPWDLDVAVGSIGYCSIIQARPGCTRIAPHLLMLLLGTPGSIRAHKFPFFIPSNSFDFIPVQEIEHRVICMSGSNKHVKPDVKREITCFPKYMYLYSILRKHMLGTSCLIDHNQACIWEILTLPPHTTWP